MKTAYWLALTSALLIGASTLLLAQTKKLVEVRKVVPADSTVLEEWQRVTDDPDLRGVNAARSKQAKWNWRVTVNAAEFARKAPWEERLQNGLLAALKRVKGVRSVAHEDREVWLVEGETSGEDLIRACSAVVDDLAGELRKQLKSL